jgi:hypothetical protein
MSEHERLSKFYSDISLLELIRVNLNDTPEKFAKKLGISTELYKCNMNKEIATYYLTPQVKERIKSIINAYFGTFKLTRKDAVDAFFYDTAMNKQFFMDKFKISERTWYNYLQGENIEKANEIDKFLLLL